MTTPYVLLPYQQAWLSDKAQVRVAEKSRRIGLTWAAGLEAVLTAAGRDGMNTLYLGYNAAMSRDFVLECAAFSRQLNLVSSEVEEELFPSGHANKHIHCFKITYASGHAITALSSRPENLRGKKGQVILDECAFIPQLSEVIKAALALTMWMGRVSLISTHNTDVSPFNQIVVDIKAGKLPYSLHSISLDTALGQGLFKRICLSTGQVWTPEAEAKWRADLFANYPDPAQADEELLLVPRSGAGAYIARESIQRCMQERPICRLKLTDDVMTKPEIERQILVDTWLADEVSRHLDNLPRHLRSYAGMDFARSGDLSVMVVLTELENLTYDMPLMIEMRNVSFELQRQVLYAVLGRLPRFARLEIDSSGNGGWLGETAQQQFGADRVGAVKFSEPKLLQIFPALKDAIENRRIVIPQNVDVLRDLRSVELIRGVPKVDPNARVKGADGLYRHGDSAVAMALALSAAMAQTEPAAGALDNSDAARIKQRTDRARRSGLWRGI